MKKQSTKYKKDPGLEADGGEHESGDPGYEHAAPPESLYHHAGPGEGSPVLTRAVRQQGVCRQGPGQRA